MGRVDLRIRGRIPGPQLLNHRLDPGLKVLPARSAGLELADVDWHRAELVVRGKGSRHDRLPLPVDVGEALAAYLMQGRPRAESRALFLRMSAPISAMTASNVSEIVRCACRRAGVAPASAHRLRHSAATQMLRAGASLPESVRSCVSRRRPTAMYAKVDQARCGRWPSPGRQVA